MSLTVLKYGKNGAKSVKKGNADTVRKFLKRLKSLEHYTVWEPNKQAYPGLDAASWLSYNDYLRGSPSSYSNPKSKDWLPIQGIRKLADGSIQMLMGKGALSNPARKRGIVAKVRKLFSQNPGGSSAKYVVYDSRQYPESDYPKYFNSLSAATKFAKSLPFDNDVIIYRKSATGQLTQYKVVRPVWTYPGRNPGVSTSKSWGRQKHEEEMRYQVSLYSGSSVGQHTPTRAFSTLAQAKHLIARVKRGRAYKGGSYDLYDRETGEFLDSGKI